MNFRKVNPLDELAFGTSDAILQSLFVTEAPAVEGFSGQDLVVHQDVVNEALLGLWAQHLVQSSRQAQVAKRWVPVICTTGPPGAGKTQLLDMLTLACGAHGRLPQVWFCWVSFSPLSSSCFFLEREKNNAMCGRLTQALVLHACSWGQTQIGRRMRRRRMRMQATSCKGTWPLLSGI